MNFAKRLQVVKSLTRAVHGFAPAGAPKTPDTAGLPCVWREGYKYQVLVVQNLVLGAIGATGQALPPLEEAWKKLYEVPFAELSAFTKAYRQGTYFVANQDASADAVFVAQGVGRNDGMRESLEAVRKFKEKYSDVFEAFLAIHKQADALPSVTQPGRLA